MYILNNEKFESRDEMVEFMKRYSFATIVTTINQIPVATQLPFYIDDSSETLKLVSHFARINEQVQHIANNTSLVLFSEPHAYISPTHYDKTESVPTWDYIAVHAYGKAKIMTDADDKLHILEQTIQFYEPEYMAQWESLSDKYKTGMMQGIVAFELIVDDLQGKKKLSQNKTVHERERIAQTLTNSNNTVEKDLANYIRP